MRVINLPFVLFQKCTFYFKKLDFSFWRLYKNYNHIKYDRDFINIREEQGFKDILASMNQAKVLKLFEGFGK